MRTISRVSLLLTVVARMVEPLLMNGVHYGKQTGGICGKVASKWCFRLLRPLHDVRRKCKTKYNWHETI